MAAENNTQKTASWFNSLLGYADNIGTTFGKVWTSVNPQQTQTPVTTTANNTPVQGTQVQSTQQAWILPAVAGVVALILVVLLVKK